MRKVFAAPDLFLSSPFPTAGSRSFSHCQVGHTCQLRLSRLRSSPPRAAEPSPWLPACAPAAGPAPRRLGTRSLLQRHRPAPAQACWSSRAAGLASAAVSPVPLFATPCSEAPAGRAATRRHLQHHTLVTPSGSTRLI